MVDIILDFCSFHSCILCYSFILLFSARNIRGFVKPVAAEVLCVVMNNVWCYIVFYDHQGTVNLWPFIILTQVVPAMTSLVVIPFIPDTPGYLLLIRNNRLDALKGVPFYYFYDCLCRTYSCQSHITLASIEWVHWKYSSKCITMRRFRKKIVPKKLYSDKFANSFIHWKGVDWKYAVVELH